VRICHPAVIAALAVTLLLPLLPASALTGPSSAVHPLPSDAELDALWAARKWNDLGEALSHPDSSASFSRSMDWLHTRLEAGGGLMLGILYARDLWILGKSRTSPIPPRTCA
jgi:hypothetical protein